MFCLLAERVRPLEKVLGTDILICCVETSVSPAPGQSGTIELDYPDFCSKLPRRESQIRQGCLCSVLKLTKLQKNKGLPYTKLYTAIYRW
jgi:hypothetical protein